MSRLSISNSEQMNLLKFIKRILLFFIPLVFLIVLLELSFYRVGETWHVDRVIELQGKYTECLYGREYFSQQMNYFKYKNIKKKAPEILILGSSRVMQVRDFIFSPLESTFYNAGGMIQNVFDISQFADLLRVGELQKPKVLFIGIDPWWLKNDWAIDGQSWLKEEVLQEDIFDILAHLTASRRFIQQGISVVHALTVGALGASPYYGYPAIGSAAINYGNGFREDGSRQYSPSIILDFIDNPQYVDREDPPVIDRIKNRQGKFSVINGVDRYRFDFLIKALAELKEMGIEVYVLMPPFSNEAMTALEDSKELSSWWKLYGKELPSKLDDLGIVSFSPSCPATYGLDDTFMIDGFHASEVLMAYVIKDIILGAQDNSLLKSVIIRKIDELINSGDTIPLAFQIPPKDLKMNEKEEKRF